MSCWKPTGGRCHLDQQGDYLVSPLAMIFPDMTDDEYARLEKSIRELGLLEDITLWQGTVIDGVHRLRACLRLGIEPRFSSLPDDADPLEYVIGRNGSRRNLAPWQRPIAAFRASESSRVGRPRSSGENCANLRNFLTQEEAAKRFGVSRRSVSAAGRVLGRESTAIPELQRAMTSGRITVSGAAAAVKEPAWVQHRAVDLLLRREARTLKQAVGIVKEQDGLTESIESAEASPVAVTDARPVFYQSPVAGLQDFVEPESVDAIVTFPPADACSGSLLTELVGFAAHSLKRTGGMFVLAGTERLPDFIERLRHPGLVWVCALHYVHDGRAASSRGNPRGGAPGQKLLLVYGKPGFRLNGGDKVISALPLDGVTQENRRSHLEIGMELIISRFTGPGDLVCNPLLLGKSASALAAVKQGRRFVGADDAASRLNDAVRQLERAGYAEHRSGGASPSAVKPSSSSRKTGRQQKDAPPAPEKAAGKRTGAEPPGQRVEATDVGQPERDGRRRQQTTHREPEQLKFPTPKRAP